MRNDEGGMFCCPAPPILDPQPTGGVAAAASVLDVADTPGCNLPDVIARGLAPVAGNDVCGWDVVVVVEGEDAAAARSHACTGIRKVNPPPLFSTTLGSEGALSAVGRESFSSPPSVICLIERQESVPDDCFDVVLVGVLSVNLPSVCRARCSMTAALLQTRFVL